MTRYQTNSVPKRLIVNFLFVLIVITGANLGCSTSDQTQLPVVLSVQDQQFIITASYGNLAEILAGNLASGKAMNGGVRTFGSTMVQDHSTAEGNLKMISDSARGYIPLQADSGNITAIQNLTNLSGTAFDTTYLRAQLVGHDKAISQYQLEINSGTYGPLKQYASQFLPTIQMHRMMADSLLKALQHP